MRRLEMIVSRLAWFVPTLAGLVVIVFLISNVIPTDPVRVLLGENATPAQLEAMRVKLGYDQPVWVQLARHFGEQVGGVVVLHLLQHVDEPLQVEVLDQAQLLEHPPTLGGADRAAQRLAR